MAITPSSFNMTSLGNSFQTPYSLVSDGGAFSLDNLGSGTLSPSDMSSLSSLVPSLKNSNGSGSIFDFLNNKSTIQGLQLGLSGLNTLGGLYTALQSLSLAKRQQAYTEQITNTNLANSVKSYNTSLADKAAARFAFQGNSGDLASYVSKNSLSTNGG